MRARLVSLEEVDSDVWIRPSDATFEPAAFVPRDRRRTRFLSFLNLKGGVGKTTLVSNLGAAFATGICKDKFKVLLVDLDFQGSLSNCCVSEESMTHRRTNGLTSAKLLEHDGDPLSLIQTLKAPLDGTLGLASVIVSDEHLEKSDFSHQAKFVANEHEVRFNYRSIFHDEGVLNEFDFVLFDCPPRLTTSTINCLFASDFVFIPTALHRHDVDSVTRSIRWLEKLRSMETFRAEMAGVILNRARKKEANIHNLTKAEKRQYEKLVNLVRQSGFSDDAIFDSTVYLSPRIPEFAEGTEPFATTEEGKRLFSGLASEIMSRIETWDFTRTRTELKNAKR